MSFRYGNVHEWGLAMATLCLMRGSVACALNILSGLMVFVLAVPRALMEALVSWDHRTKIPLPNPLDRNSGAFSKTFDLSGADAHLIDHNVDGRIIIPVSASLVTRLAFPRFL